MCSTLLRVSRAKSLFPTSIKMVTPALLNSDAFKNYIYLDLSFFYIEKKTVIICSNAAYPLETVLSAISNSVCLREKKKSTHKLSTIQCNWFSLFLKYESDRSCSPSL